jgi:hypothetical protein
VRTGVNGVPTISGTPANSVVPGRAYSFKPTAHDPEGSGLIFNIVSKPRWATFDIMSGALAGTPGSSDVGDYDNIMIGVSDGTYYVTTPRFKVSVVGTATGSINVNWSPPTQRVDGSALVNLAGYKLYWGTSSGNYPNSTRIDNPGIATYLIEQLTPGTYYVVATAFDAQGIESGYSNEVTKTIAL